MDDGVLVEISEFEALAKQAENLESGSAVKLLIADNSPRRHFRTSEETLASLERLREIDKILDKAQTVTPEIMNKRFS